MEERLRSKHNFTEIRPFDLNIRKCICQVKLACALKSLLNRSVTALFMFNTVRITLTNFVT